MIDALFLWTAHTLGDYFAQTNWMAVNKSKNNVALLMHVAVYTLVMGLATLSLTFAAITFVAHFTTDWVTSRVSRRLFPFVRWIIPRSCWIVKAAITPTGSLAYGPCSAGAMSSFV